MKPDEKALLLALYEADQKDPERPIYVRAWLPTQPINKKRACYLLEKWTSKGWYDYGVNLMAGWLTPDGREAARGLLGVAPR